MSIKNNTIEIVEDNVRPDTKYQIDKYNLDQECLSQADNYRQSALSVAIRQDKLNEAQAEFDLVKAELSLEVRRDPTKFNVPGRMSNEVVEAVLVTLPKYKEALKALNKAKYRFSVAKVDEATMRTKKDMIENLVMLKNNDYWAEPRKNRGLREQRSVD